jgi:hypothetical protein
MPPYLNDGQDLPLRGMKKVCNHGAERFKMELNVTPWQTQTERDQQDSLEFKLG